VLLVRAAAVWRQADGSRIAQSRRKQSCSFITVEVCWWVAFGPPKL
jgi:hypothetical protein